MRRSASALFRVAIASARFTLSGGQRPRPTSPPADHHALNAAYIKDEIISVGGLFYAVATFIAVRALLETIPRRRAAASALIALFLMADAGLWAFRAAGVHYVLRYDAFKTRNDWVELLRPDKREDWPTDQQELAITRRIRDEVILRKVASPSFMPRWADRYWVE